MKKKIAKKFFIFQIIPYDLVALYCLYQGRVVAIGTQCVRKQISDFSYYYHRPFVGQLTAQ